MAMPSRRSIAGSGTTAPLLPCPEVDFAATSITSPIGVVPPPSPPSPSSASSALASLRSMNGAGVKVPGMKVSGQYGQKASGGSAPTHMAPPATPPIMPLALLSAPLPSNAAPPKGLQNGSSAIGQPACPPPAPQLAMADRSTKRRARSSSSTTSAVALSVDTANGASIPPSAAPGLLPTWRPGNGCIDGPGRVTAHAALHSRQASSTDALATSMLGNPSAPPSTARPPSGSEANPGCDSHAATATTCSGVRNTIRRIARPMRIS